jgi:acyl dehydratase
MPDFIPLEQAPAWIGRELFISPWMTTSVRHLELFHAATELDPAVTDMAICETNPAPDLVDGFWLQSMLAATHFNHNPIRSPGMWGLNLGSDKVRFITPVQVGQRIRYRCVLDAVLPHAHGTVLVTTNTAEVEGITRPAMVAVMRTLSSTESALPSTAASRAGSA